MINREELNGLRFSEKKSLGEIASHFGVSRQRVHQLLGNTGRMAVAAGGSAKHSNSALESDDFWEANAGKPDIILSKLSGATLAQVQKTRRSRGVLPTRPKYHNARLGFDAEQLVISKLSKAGIAFKKMRWLAPYDILANNKRIDVKASMPKGYDKKLAHQQYVFMVGANKRGKCDIYICVAQTKSGPEFFIIPSADIPDHMEHLAFCYPSNKTGGSGKWQSYRDAWQHI